MNKDNINNEANTDNAGAEAEKETVNTDAAPAEDIKNNDSVESEAETGIENEAENSIVDEASKEDDSNGNNADADSEAPVEEIDDSGDDDDFSASIDLPLPTPEEMENTLDIDLPEFSQQDNEKKKIIRNKIVKWLLIALGAIVAIIVIIYVACIVTLPTETVSRGVYIENIDMSGLTYDEVLNKIEQAYMLENQQITLTCNDQSFTINGSDIGLSVRPEETAQKAFDFGKSGNKLMDGITAVGLLAHKHKIIPVASADAELLKEKLNEFGTQIFGERKNHYVEIGEEKAIVWPGCTGYDGNSDTACEEVQNAIANEKFTNIPVSLASAPPAELTLEQFDLFVYKDPVDAYFTVEDNNVSIVESSTGRYIDKDESAALLQNVAEGGGPVEIPYYISYPAITSDQLSAKLFANTMASYKTSFASSTSNRASNVARAASLINGKVLAPGEVFSFNDTVGKRTVANGFSTAPEYVNGKTVEGIGGGTCQVSSTLYNAVLYADLEVVSRTNHMFTVSYVPNGQDATVADGGPDFKFRNNTDYPVKISAYTSGGQITVSIIGTNWEPAREVKINNSTSYSNNGDTIVRTTRTVSANGEVIRTETMPSSTYKQHKQEETTTSTNTSTTTSSTTTETTQETTEETAEETDEEN